MDQLYYLSLYYIKFGIQTLICVCVRYVRTHTHNTEMYLNFILKMSFLQYENNLLKLFIVPCNSQLQKH